MASSNMISPSREERSSRSSSLSAPRGGNANHRKLTLSPQNRITRSISSLKHLRNLRGRPDPLDLVTQDTSAMNTEEEDDGDLGKSKYMMKSIVGLLTTASVYAGMDDAQGASDLGQDVFQDDQESEQYEIEEGCNVIDNAIDGSKNLKNYTDDEGKRIGPDMHRLEVRKPTLFDFSVVPSAEGLTCAESSNSCKNNTKNIIVNKLVHHFKLDETETFLKEFSAWLLKDVLVQGQIFLTSRHLLFFAYLPKSPGTVKMSGNLNIRSTLRGSTRYWCVLKDHMFSLYSSPTEVYFPVLTIDLRNATTIQVERKTHNDLLTKNFKVSTNEKTFTFIADSEYSARTWCNALKKQQFAAQNSENDSVSLKIPLRNIIDVDDQSIVNQALTLRIRALESTHTFAIDDYIFVFLNGSGLSLKGIIQRQLMELEESGARISLKASSSSTAACSTTEPGTGEYDKTSEKQNVVTSPKTENQPHQRKFSIVKALRSSSPISSEENKESEKALGGNFWMRRLRSKSGSWLSRSSSNNSLEESVVIEYYSKTPSNVLDNAPQIIQGSDLLKDDKDNQDGIPESRRTRITDWTTKPFKNMAEMWTAQPIHYLNDYITFSEDDPYLMKDKDKVAANERFKQHFKIDDDDVLISAYFTHLTRNVPLYGKVYIAKSIMCFRTLLPRINTKMILPLNDIETCYKEKGFRFGYFGLVVVIRGHEELFFEFSTASARDDTEYVLLKRLDSIKSKRKVPISPTANLVETDSNNAKLKFFEDKISAEGFEVPLLIDENPYFKTNITPTRSYKIGMLTIGSRGDVQPYVALGKGLIKEGHQVTIITHGEFRDFVTDHNIGFEEIAGNPAELMSLMVEHESMNVGLLRDASVRFRGWITALLDSSWKVCSRLNLDMLIESPSAMAGIHIAEALKIPYFRAFTMPWTRTRAYPHAFIVPDQKRGGNYNYLTHVLFENIFWKGISGQVNKWRVESLGLSKTNLDLLQQSKVPFFYNISPTIFPPSVDFSEWIKVTGYWFLDEKADYTPPDTLREFIKKARELNKKLVYIGFGSIVVSNAKEMTKAITEAVEEAGVYCILNKGWSERLCDKPSEDVEVELPECIYNAGSVPHDWLFPQLDAAVHHGGSGTTGATLRAGLPTIIKPFFGDQFFYALRVEDIGTGIALKKLNSATLARALKEVTTNKRMLDRATLVKKQISSEDGVKTAINCLYGELEYARSLLVSKNKKDNSGTFEEVTSVTKNLFQVAHTGLEESWTLL